MTKGRISEQALKHNDADPPDIYTVIVGLLGQNLWRDVVRSPDFREFSLR